MIILALSTSSRIASAALYRDGDLFLELHGKQDVSHSEGFMPVVDSILSYAEIGVRDVDCFAVDVGPGSFTGVRIGVAAANAMASVFDKPIVEVPSLLALKYSTGKSTESFPVCTLIDARNDNIYGAFYDEAQTILPEAASLEDFLKRLCAYKGTNVYFVGDGAQAYKKRIEELFEKPLFLPESQNFVSASLVGKAAIDLIREGKTVKLATPSYLRPSQAERMKAAKEATVTARSGGAWSLE